MNGVTVIILSIVVAFGTVGLVLLILYVLWKDTQG